MLKMKGTKILTLSIIIVFILFGFILYFIVLPNLKKNPENVDSETGESVSLFTTKPEEINYVDDGVFVDSETGEPVSLSTTKPEEIYYVDDGVFKIIKEIYGKIDFGGKFNKGNEEDIDLYKNQYLRLLKCEVPFFDKQTQKEYFINEFSEMDYNDPYPQLIYNGELSDVYDPNSYIYYFFDMDGDGNPELCVTNERRFVYIIKYEPNSSRFTLWHEITGWTSLVGSKKLRYYSGTHPIRWAYIELDQYGDEECWVLFYLEEYYDEEKNQVDTIYALTLPEFTDKSKNFESYVSIKHQAFFTDQYDSQYYFRVTEEQWNELTKEFFDARDLAKEGINEVRFTYDELFGLGMNQ